MPLSDSAPRDLLHLRDIALRGYLREDGAIDVEAHLADTKTYDFPNHDRGRINRGDELHGMWLRLTVDESMTILAAEAAMDATPHAVCPGAAPNFARLAGLTIGRGFLKRAMERVGGTAGCTHLRELLQQVATVAVQTMFSVRAHRSARAGQMKRDDWGVPSFLLNTCFAYDENGPLVAQRREMEKSDEAAE